MSRAALKSLVGKLLQATRIELLPVKVREGIAKGAWWTLYPFSAYWRGGFEPELRIDPSGSGGQWQITDMRIACRMRMQP